VKLFFAGLSPRKGRFNTGPVHVGFVVEKNGTRRGFWKKILSPLSVAIMTPGLHIHVHLQADMPQSQMGETWRIAKGKVLSKMRSTG
jgi:hypothetical protein